MPLIKLGEHIIATEHVTDVEFDLSFDLGHRGVRLHFNGSDLRTGSRELTFVDPEEIELLRWWFTRNAIDLAALKASVDAQETARNSGSDGRG